MTCLDNDMNQQFQDAIDVIEQNSNNSYYSVSEFPLIFNISTIAASSRPSRMFQLLCTTHGHTKQLILVLQQQSWPQPIPDVSLGHPVPIESPHFYSILPPPRTSKGRKKLRLYEYLHEALNDPNMGDSIQWTDSSSGTFHFISKNKEKLAECWGQRKGNRKTMTYQKMARALRNYSRTGEIIKVRRKLTYQFNPDILHRLGSTQVSLHLPCHTTQEEVHSQQQSSSEHSYCGSAAADWHSWYGHYQLQEDYDLASSFTSHTTKL
ncbi:Transcription factor Spi-C [Channa argus]|uniref:Transcription factor Spi-C n=1 Tax=Channa argus TaxID=215402 RepID=A0A6G1QRL7_CHAAH|nr:Transcription factor Spi-C [Channa argus]